LHPDSESSLQAWYKTAKKAEWKTLAAVRKVYPQADAVGNYTVFNIRGNRYRLIAEINYQFQQILIRKLTHKEYIEGNWKS
jgi:mRNA interferase HigB